MFIKKLDYLSPPVTFYHQGLLSHASILSGIISIFSIIGIISFAVYFSLDIINKNDPKTFSFNSFIEDAGIFPINASSLFHFISMASLSSNYLNDGVDFTTFNIIGFEEYYETYLYDKNLTNFNHWLYGRCSNQTDTEGISTLINYEYFERSACIRKYFSKIDQKYYNTGDPKFKWPIISNGTFNKNYGLYNIIIERCQNNIIKLILGEGHECQKSSEFEELYQNFTIYGESFIYFINHYVDILNYTNPYKKYFYVVESFLPKNSFITNHLNFNPSIIETHNGLIFDSMEEKNAHIYDRNDVFITDKSDIFMAYVFWLKNSMYYNKRIYKRIPDIISSIGGVYQFITIVSIYINSLYNHYIVLSDTENLLHSSIHTEKHNNNKIEIRKEKEKEKEKENIKNKKIKELDREKNNSENKNYLEQKIKKEKPNRNVKNIKINNNSQSNNFIVSSDKINDKINANIEINNNNNKIKYINFENKPTLRRRITHFFDFLLYEISCCKKKKHYFKVYKDFRIKIISEEHLIRNHLNIYNLLRITERKRHYRRNSYQIEDLIKLV